MEIMFTQTLTSIIYFLRTGMTNESRNKPFIDSLNRRSYLKAAFSSVGLAAVGGVSATSGDFDVVKVAPGDTHRVRIGDNETFENVLIDISSKGAGYEIVADGNDWEIRNIGIKGEWDHIPNNQPFRVAVPNENATGTIDTVYLGDGVKNIDTWRPNDNPAGIWTYWYHAGELDIYRCNIQEFPDNAIYGSQAGNSSDHPNPGSNGIVRVHDTYSANNKTSNLRLGTDGSYAKNCVLWNNYHKGYWQFYYSGELIDCDIGPADGRQHLNIGSGTWKSGSNTELIVTNTRFDEGAVRTRRGGELIGSSAGEPVHRIPEGCPTTAEEAAAGTSSNSETTEEKTASAKKNASLNNVVIFDGREASTPTTDYEFVVSEAVEPSTDEDATIDPQASVDGINAKGVVANYLDAWRFDGEIEQLSVDGDAAVRVNGVEVDPDDFVDVGSEDNKKLPNVVVFDGREASTSTTDYEFVVSEAVEPSTDEGATIDPQASVDGVGAKGVVANYLDAWRFDGEIEQLSIDGDATVRVNGVVVDPDNFAETDR